MNRRELAEELIDNPEAVFMDGLDAALVGIASQYPHRALAVYDRAGIRLALMAQGMDADGAREWAEYNIEDAYVGPGTPLILDRLEEPD